MAKELKSAANVIIGGQKKEETAPRTEEPKAAPAPKVVPQYEEPEYKTERTQILLRKSTKKALKKIAKTQTHGSLNELINRICEEYIAAQEQ